MQLCQKLIMIVAVLVSAQVFFAQQKPVALKEDPPIAKLAGIKPFLILPVPNAKTATVSEGFYYHDETAITGQTYHGAVDISAPEGTPVICPCSGIARASFQTLGPITNDQKALVLYNGKQIHSAAGFCLQIECDEQPVLVLLGHLKEVRKDLYREPEKVGDLFKPTPILVQTFGGDGVRVRAGEVVGRVGVSGLGYFQETPEHTATAKESWDEPHVHFWCGLRGADGRRATDFDVFGWYGSTAEFPYRGMKQHPQYGLFKKLP